MEINKKSVCESFQELEYKLLRNESREMSQTHALKTLSPSEKFVLDLQKMMGESIPKYDCAEKKHVQFSVWLLGHADIHTTTIVSVKAPDTSYKLVQKDERPNVYDCKIPVPRGYRRYS